MYVFKNCKAFRRTVPLLQYDPLKPEDLDTEGEDHVADEVRYFCMARPISPRPAAGKKRQRTNAELFLDIEESDLGAAIKRPGMEIINET